MGKLTVHYILSRARQLKGLFMCKTLHSSVSFELPDELKAYKQFSMVKKRASNVGEARVQTKEASRGR